MGADHLYEDEDEWRERVYMTDVELERELEREADRQWERADWRTFEIWGV